MAKLVVMEDAEVRKMIKEELRNLFNDYLKNQLSRISTKMDNIDSRLYGFENKLK